MLVAVLAALQFLQHQDRKREKNQQIIQKQTDSLTRAQYYSYVLSYGDIVKVPLEKNMLLTDSGMKTTTIANVVSKRTYVFHFDETNCFTCVEKYVPYLLRLSKRLGSDNLIILGSYQNPANLFNALEPFNLSESGIKIFNLAPSYLSTSKLAALNAPYIFEIDNTLNASRFFIPEKSFSELSELYEKNTPY